jgi:Domain of unknown function (DUF4333)
MPARPAPEPPTQSWNYLPPPRAAREDAPVSRVSSEPEPEPPPVGPKPRKRRSRTQVVGFSVLAAAVVLSVGAGIFAALSHGRSSGQVVNETALEQAIEQQSNGALTDLTCPANEKVRAGTTFQCTAANNKTITVTIKDADGSYDWALAN